jgi:hypothetical protein
VANWNTAAALSTGEILLVIADDLTPPQGWDEQVEKLPAGDKEWACYVPDTVRSDGLMCHPILSRAALQQARICFPSRVFRRLLRQRFHRAHATRMPDPASQRS